MSNSWAQPAPAPAGSRCRSRPAVKAGPFVFVSGQVAMGDNGEIVPGGIEAQTRQTLKNVEKALALAGCTAERRRQVHGVAGRRARLLDVQPRLRRILPREQTGAIDDAGDADDRRQSRDRSHRLPGLANFAFAAGPGVLLPDGPGCAAPRPRTALPVSVRSQRLTRCLAAP